MPFFHLEEDLWDLEREPGAELTDQPGRLAKARARGRLRPEVEQLLRRPEVLSRAARLLLDDHFTDSYVDPITSAVGRSGNTPELSACVPEEKNPLGIPLIFQPEMASNCKSSQLRFRSTGSARSRMRCNFPSIGVASAPGMPVQAKFSAWSIST